jgi:hypothetical protein
MAKYLGDGTVLGAVYEKDGRFFYECEHCSTSFSGGDERRLELKADAHEREHDSDTPS